MKNSLLQQLCNHITYLQTQNQKLKTLLEKHSYVIQQICRITNFPTWNHFIDWVYQQFPIHNSKFNTQNPNLLLNKKFDMSIQKIEKKLSLSHDLASIQEISHQSLSSSIQMKKRLIQSQISIINKWGTQTYDFSNIQKTKIEKSRNQDEQFTQIQQIVLQNTELRHTINILKQELQQSQKSFFSLLKILKTQQKQKQKEKDISTQISSKRESYLQDFMN